MGKEGSVERGSSEAMEGKGKEMEERRMGRERWGLRGNGVLREGKWEGFGGVFG